MVKSIKTFKNRQLTDNHLFRLNWIRMKVISMNKNVLGSNDVVPITSQFDFLLIIRYWTSLCCDVVSIKINNKIKNI